MPRPRRARGRRSSVTTSAARSLAINRATLAAPAKAGGKARARYPHKQYPNDLCCGGNGSMGRRAVTPGTTPADELHRLADLKDRGVIDDAEFQKLKSKVIS